MAIRAHKIRTAAALLELSERKTRELVSSGELDSITIGRSRRVTDEQLSTYLGRRQADAKRLAEQRK